MRCTIKDKKLSQNRSPSSRHSRGGLRATAAGVETSYLAPAVEAQKGNPGPRHTHFALFGLRNVRFEIVTKYNWDSTTILAVGGTSDCSNSKGSR